MSAAEYNDPRLKLLPARTAALVLAVALGVLALAVGIASLPWAAPRVESAPRVTATARGAGSLRAGASEVRFALPRGTPIAGFTRLRWGSEGNHGPVGARALVLDEPGCRIALVTAELLLVPESLHAEVAAKVQDLGLTGLLLAATHTHAGPGGYWESALGSHVATGPYDPAVRAAIVAAIEQAIREAADALAPARLTTAGSAADDLARSRSGGLEDAPLNVLRLEAPDGGHVAEVTIFAAHGTLLGPRNRVISGDWPGRFLQGGAHGLRLFFQGAIGDQSTEGPSAGSPRGFANVLSSRVAALPFGTPDPAPPLAWAEAELGLPDADIAGAPWLLRRAARNLALYAFPATARVVAVRLGPMLLVAVPAEPVAAVAADWRGKLPPRSMVVSLANGYIGYVEEPERVKARRGESDRTYYGPRLATVLGEAVKLAADATAAPAAGATSSAARSPRSPARAARAPRRCRAGRAGARAGAARGPSSRRRARRAPRPSRPAR